MKNFVFLLLICFSAHSIKSQTIGLGQCPRTQVIQDFDISRYLGKWYEIAKYPNLFQRGKCTEAVYGPVNRLGHVEVLNKEISNNQVSAVRGFARQNLMHGADLEVFLKVPFAGMQRSGYDVLATDYEGFAVVHACRKIGPFKAEFGWILSRNRILTPEQESIVEETIKRNGLDSGSFEPTSQEDCPNLDGLPFRLIA